MPKKRWLKKYTKLEYLGGILGDRQLHLGDPSVWEDKNDCEGIRLFSEANGGFKILSTCLTEAADRFHFWHIFGERENGVCLWFDRDLLVRDIRRDNTLVAAAIQYRSLGDLRHLPSDQVPFAKREQYRDECEFRILRVRTSTHTPADKIKFSKDSLLRVYLNPWLSVQDVAFQKARITEMIKEELDHVQVFQNKTLNYQPWIEAMSAATGPNN